MTITCAPFSYEYTFICSVFTPLIFIMVHVICSVACLHRKILVSHLIITFGSNDSFMTKWDFSKLLLKSNREYTKVYLSCNFLGGLLVILQHTVSIMFVKQLFHKLSYVNTASETCSNSIFSHHFPFLSHGVKLLAEKPIYGCSCTTQG